MPSLFVEEMLGQVPQVRRVLHRALLVRVDPVRKIFVGITPVVRPVEMEKWLVFELIGGRLIDRRRIASPMFAIVCWNDVVLKSILFSQLYQF